MEDPRRTQSGEATNQASHGKSELGPEGQPVVVAGAQGPWPRGRGAARPPESKRAADKPDTAAPSSVAVGAPASPHPQSLAPTEGSTQSC